MGNFSLVNVCQRVAPIVRKSMRAFWSAAWIPAAVATIIGKTATKAESATLEAMPKPSQETNRGAKATLGIALISNQIGHHHPLAEVRLANEQPEGKAESDCNAKAKQHLLGRCPQRFQHIIPGEQVQTDRDNVGDRLERRGQE